MASTEMSLKLLIDTRVKRVLFAEAGKDSVAVLFTLLSLPLATVIRLLTKNGMVGCLGNVYGSIEKLDKTYLQPKNKNTLLKPKAPISAGGVPLLISQYKSPCQKLYMCPNSHRNVADDPNSVCPQCRSKMSNEMSYVARTSAEKASSGEGGYVKGVVVTYTVMDDLVVRPMSTISCITLLNQFNVKEVVMLEEREVDVSSVIVQSTVV